MTSTPASVWGWRGCWQRNPPCRPGQLLFQPAEELAQGAVWIRDAGATQGLQALFGVHVVPDLPAGTVGVRSGCLTAAAGELEITVQGVGGHGARPHQSVDAIWLAARVVTSAAMHRATTECLAAGGDQFREDRGRKAFNVIADQVRLLGTVRCLDLEQHRQLPQWIEQTVDEICRSGGGEAQVRYRCIAPPVWNDAALTSLLETAAVGCLGRERVLPVELPSLGAEDFAELLRDVPGTMMRLASRGRRDARCTTVPLTLMSGPLALASRCSPQRCYRMRRGLKGGGQSPSGCPSGRR